jgi:hypothetical protein
MASKSFTTRSAENPKRRANSPRRKPPGAIGEGDLLAVDRPRHRQGRGTRTRAGLIEVARDRRLEVRGGIVLDDEDAFGPPRRIGERETALAAADIGEKGLTHTGAPGLTTIW